MMALCRTKQASHAPIPSRVDLGIRSHSSRWPLLNGDTINRTEFELHRDKERFRAASYMCSGLRERVIDRRKCE